MLMSQHRKLIPFRFLSSPTFTCCVFTLTDFFLLHFIHSFGFDLHDLSSSSLQVPGELHGGRQGRIHERKPSQWHAHHHPTQEVHGAHQDYLSAGEETQIGNASPDGGGRRAGQPAGGGRSGWSSVPRVGSFSPLPSRSVPGLRRPSWCCSTIFKPSVGIVHVAVQ